MSTQITFGNAIDGTPSWGDRWTFQFGGSWVFNDQWAILASFQTIPVLLGAGQVTTNGQPTYCFTYKERVYLANNQVFNFCDNDNPTEWEVQGPGSGFIQYLSQLGQQDSVVTFGQLQGRLAVFASRSIQMWQVDADPAQFAIIQQLNNRGTVARQSTQNQGDYDTLFLDPTGDRSLRASELTLNAFIDDAGTPIDALILTASSGGTTNACSVTDPATQNYWLFLGTSIFVRAHYPQSKISAWSVYTPIGSDGSSFVPTKFVVFNNQVYCRGTSGVLAYLYQYGGSNNATYDNQVPVKVQIPWLDDRRPARMKHFTGVDYVIQGKWNLFASANPQNNSGVPSDAIGTPGSAATPANLTDSSYDIGHVSYDQTGTHFSVYAVSASTSTTVPVKFAALGIHYNDAGLS